MSHIPDPAAPLVATGNLRRRMAVNALAESATVVATLAALAVLGILIVSVLVRGGGALSLDFITKDPPRFGGPGGGIAPDILGTALIVAVGTAIAMPIGVLVAVFLTEYAGPRTTRPIRLALDLLNGLPSVVVGLFVFGLMVVGHHQSGLAASVALAIIMVPLVARASQEMLTLVPTHLREAGDALGVSRWRSVIGVVLPSAMGGIVTGTVLAVARAAGETAPLIFVDSIYRDTTTFDIFHPVPNIPISIFTLSQADDPAGFQRAWGAAFVLLALILLANIGARVLLARSRRRLSS